MSNDGSDYLARSQARNAHDRGRYPDQGGHGGTQITGSVRFPGIYYRHGAYSDTININTAQAIPFISSIFGGGSNNRSGGQQQAGDPGLAGRIQRELYEVLRDYNDHGYGSAKYRDEIGDLGRMVRHLPNGANTMILVNGSSMTAAQFIHQQMGTVRGIQPEVERDMLASIGADQGALSGTGTGTTTAAVSAPSVPHIAGSDETIDVEAAAFTARPAREQVEHLLSAGHVQRGGQDLTGDARMRLVLDQVTAWVRSPEFQAMTPAEKAAALQQSAPMVAVFPTMAEANAASANATTITQAAGTEGQRAIARQLQTIDEELSHQFEHDAATLEGADRTRTHDLATRYHQQSEAVGERANATTASSGQAQSGGNDADEAARGRAREAQYARLQEISAQLHEAGKTAEQAAVDEYIRQQRGAHQQGGFMGFLAGIFQWLGNLLTGKGYLNDLNGLAEHISGTAPEAAAAIRAIESGDPAQEIGATNSASANPAANVPDTSPCSVTIGDNDQHAYGGSIEHDTEGQHAVGQILDIMKAGTPNAQNEAQIAALLVAHPQILNLRVTVHRSDFQLEDVTLRAFLNNPTIREHGRMNAASWAERYDAIVTAAQTQIAAQGQTQAADAQAAPAMTAAQVMTALQALDTDHNAANGIQTTDATGLRAIAEVETMLDSSYAPGQHTHDHQLDADELQKLQHVIEQPDSHNLQVVVQRLSAAGITGFETRTDTSGGPPNTPPGPPVPPVRTPT